VSFLTDFFFTGLRLNEFLANWGATTCRFRSVVTDRNRPEGAGGHTAGKWVASSGCARLRAALDKLNEIGQVNYQTNIKRDSYVHGTKPSLAKFKANVLNVYFVLGARLNSYRRLN
jgi:hypothetical protein